MNIKTLPKLLIFPLVITLFTACTKENVPEPTLIPVVEPIQAPKVEPVIQIQEQPILQKDNSREEVMKFVKNLMNDFAKNDLALINSKYINPKFGFYNLFKLNGENSFQHQAKIFNFTEEDSEEIWIIIRELTDEIKSFPIIEQDVKFDCSPESDEFYGWNGSGLYLSKKTKTYLSDMMKNANIQEANKYSTQELENADFIEKNAYKVVLTPELVFYVNKIGKKWYITLFDRITTDCSTPRNSGEK